MPSAKELSAKMLSDIQSNITDTIPPSFFSANRPKGKVAELRQELNSGGKKDKNNSAKKIALKKIVANMTMSNNDMVALFPDVVGCMQLPSLEIKKMYVDPFPELLASQVDDASGVFCSWSTTLA